MIIPTNGKKNYQANKGKLQLRSREYNRNLSEDNKIEKEIMLTIEKNMTDEDRERKKKNT